MIFKTSFVQLNSTSLLFLDLSAACSFHHCCCCQLGSKPVFTHECLSKIGLVTLKYFSVTRPISYRISMTKLENPNNKARPQLSRSVPRAGGQQGPAVTPGP